MNNARCDHLGAGDFLDLAGRAGTVIDLDALTQPQIDDVLLASDLFEFSWRYQLPALVTLPPAGALGITVIIGYIAARRRRDSRPVPGPGREPAPVPGNGSYSGSGQPGPDQERSICPTRWACSRTRLRSGSTGTWKPKAYPLRRPWPSGWVTTEDPIRSGCAIETTASLRTTLG